MAGSDRLSILIGGAAGQGMDTLTAVLEKHLQRLGYWTFTTRDYMSRVRGGHNFNQTVFGSSPIHSHVRRHDAVVALDAQTAALHAPELAEGGVLVVDEGEPLPDGLAGDPRVVRLPLAATAAAAGAAKSAGSAALGAVLACCGVRTDGLDALFALHFAPDVVAKNAAAFLAGTALAPRCRTAPKPPTPDGRLLLNGNEAVALGAIAAGCRFYSAYPMTPSTSILNALAERGEAAGLLVEQAEDEIAAIHMAIGASYAGVRAMTGTSGGGFCLMVEALGLSGMAEIPLVVADIQRPGPVTGFPTRTEQGDLRFVVSASHGEFPRLVLSMRTPADAFRQTLRAFDLADRFRIPVILLGDQFLADTTATVPPFPLDGIPYDRHAGTPDLSSGAFLTYADAPDGLSPRIVPGTVPGAFVRIDSDEHDSSGAITESAEVRVANVRRRLATMRALEDAVEEPEFLGDEAFDTLLLCWGSTREPVADALARLQAGAGGRPRYAALAFGDVWPLPRRELLRRAEQAKEIVDVEQNATAQFASLVAEATGLRCARRILKYDGRAMSGEWIAEGLVNGHG